jgi:hypothetical protein
MKTAGTRAAFALSAPAVAALAGVVLAGAALTSGCGSAASRTPTAAPTPLATSPAARSARSAGTTATGGTAYIADYSANSDGPTSRVILTGAIGDFGTAVSVHANGAIDPGHSSDLRLRLTHGSFRLAIADLGRNIARAFRHWPGDARTCSGDLRVTAATPIIAGSGTGAYRGISGTFKVTATIDEVDMKPACDGTGKFLAQLIIIAGSGTVSFR